MFMVTVPKFNGHCDIAKGDDTHPAPRMRRHTVLKATKGGGVAEATGKGAKLFYDEIEGHERKSAKLDQRLL